MPKLLENARVTIPCCLCRLCLAGPHSPDAINSAAGPFGLGWTPATLIIAAEEKAGCQFADPSRLLSEHPSIPSFP